MKCTSSLERHACVLVTLLQFVLEFTAAHGKLAAPLASELRNVLKVITEASYNLLNLHPVPLMLPWHQVTARRHTMVKS